MALKKMSLKTTSVHENTRLDQTLASWLPTVLNQPISKGKVRKLIMAGAVYLNRSRVMIASKGLRANALIEVYVDLDRLTTQGEKNAAPNFTLTSEHVLYEDEHLIAFNKPSGLPTQPTLDEARINLFTAAKKFLATRDQIPESQIYLGLHHRLDRDTSGVIILTKTKNANPGIADAFSTHKIQKTYHALTIRSQHLLPSLWTVKNFLGKLNSAGNKSNGKKSKFGAIRSGGNLAITDFKVLQKFQEFTYIEAKPKTGRTHQIRVHLSEQGIPILGDPFYGGPTRMGSTPVPRVMLHAYTLQLEHPITQKEIRIEAPLSEDFQKLLGKGK